MRSKRKRKLYKVSVRFVEDPTLVVNYRIKRFSLFGLFIKAVAFALIVSLNWAGLSAVIETVAFLNDKENSRENTFVTTTLDFSLNAGPDFNPEVKPSQNNSLRDISIVKNGALDFEYTLKTENEIGYLCDFLNLTVTRNGVDIGYSGTLKDFTYNAGQFSEPDNWQFTAIFVLTSVDLGLENETCTFDLVFDGSQINGAGFSDQEIISNTIASGQWVIPPPANLKINEVYYHVGPQHGSEPDNEWIEIYNPVNSVVNISGWRITDNSGWERTFCVPPSTCSLTSIPAYGFVVITPATSTWDYWPDIPSETVKVVLDKSIGNGLANTGDRVILRDADGVEIDAVSWLTDDYAFGPGNGVTPATGAGHSIARKIKGLDTDSPDDWQKLINPNPGTNPHLIDEEELIIEEFGEEPVPEENDFEEEIFEIEEEEIVADDGEEDEEVVGESVENENEETETIVEGEETADENEEVIGEKEEASAETEEDEDEVNGESEENEEMEEDSPLLIVEEEIVEEEIVEEEIVEEEIVEEEVIEETIKEELVDEEEPAEEEQPADEEELVEAPEAVETEDSGDSEDGSKSGGEEPAGEEIYE